MGCVASRPEQDEAVSVCKERKRQLKLAVERRYALAEAHWRYHQSLYGVAAAIKLYVSPLSSQTSPFLITFPSPCPSPLMAAHDAVTNPLFLQQNPTDSAGREASGCDARSSGSLTFLDSSEEETKEGERGVEDTFGCLPEELVQTGFGWDFFNPFDSCRRDIPTSYQRRSYDHFRAISRKDEGIPETGSDEVEEDDDKMGFPKEEEEEEEDKKAKMEEFRDESDVTDTQQGRDLLESLKDIQDHFIRAYDSGNQVSRMLETGTPHLLSGLDELKENSTKRLHAITWHRSLSKSSCKSIVASSSCKSSSTWSEFKNELFDDDHGGMDSGSHALTLGRLCAWEKKLYDEVKIGNNTRRIYERKCFRLNQSSGEEDEVKMNKTRAEIKDLYARIVVALRSAETISKKIESLRKEELQPQIIELLKGLTDNWQIMLEAHETQIKVVSEMKYDTASATFFFTSSNNARQLATLQLEAEIQNWCVCFADYVDAQKSYAKAIYTWLTKFLTTNGGECYRRGASSTAPPLLVICHDWLSLMEKLPVHVVTSALKSFSKDARALWAGQREEMQQKRKAESLVRELEKKTNAYKKTENRYLESRLSGCYLQADDEHGYEFLSEKKDLLDTCRKKLDQEIDKLHFCMQQTQSISLNLFRAGFSSVFEAFSDFSKASIKMYNALVDYD